MTIIFSRKLDQHLVQFTLPGQAHVLENTRFVYLFHALEAMRERGGGFASTLAAAWMRADSSNDTKLRIAFADLVASYASFAPQEVWMDHARAVAAAPVVESA